MGKFNKTILSAQLLLAVTSFFVLHSAWAVDEVVATNLEPYHHVILENKYVTVMRVMIPAGKTTLFHEQHLDYVNTHIDGSTVEISYLDKPTADSEMKSGNVKFGAHQDVHEVDKVKNTSSHLNMHVGFEIKKIGPQHFGNTSRPDTSAFQNVLDKKTVRGWKVTLQAGETTTAYTQYGPGVRVFFTEGRLLVNIPGKINRNKEIWVHKGDAMLTNAGRIELTNGGDMPLVFNDYELL
ncbi:MAG: hypothetical protein P4L95_12780 [Rouxiella aceris]|uniref:hypothetical protein n=1 Tax=Rouxiella aceris TaxID=2703884 RepID=UPI00283FCADE|nr:hypothetical protein [Rouxiella aceris]MDR3432757.1 hypothetical protein [Rouxiella aceris]